jgi:hypothetical protein
LPPAFTLVLIVIASSPLHHDLRRAAPAGLDTGLGRHLLVSFALWTGSSVLPANARSRGRSGKIGGAQSRRMLDG